MFPLVPITRPISFRYCHIHMRIKKTISRSVTYLSEASVVARATQRSIPSSQESHLNRRPVSIHGASLCEQLVRNFWITDDNERSPKNLHRPRFQWAASERGKRALSYLYRHYWSLKCVKTGRKYTERRSIDLPHCSPHFANVLQEWDLSDFQCYF